MQHITTIDKLKAHLAEGKSVSYYDSDISLESADLRSADLRSADLESADLESADLESADLESADLRSAKHIVSVTGVGSNGRTAYFVNHANDVIMVQAGCFWGTTDELLERSRAMNDLDHIAGYEAAYNYARVILAQHRMKYPLEVKETE